MTYRQLAAQTGWSVGIVGGYFTGTALPPTDRFDRLIGVLGALPDEILALAAARDRVEEARHAPGEAPTLRRGRSLWLAQGERSAQSGGPKQERGRRPRLPIREAEGRCAAVRRLAQTRVS